MTGERPLNADGRLEQATQIHERGDLALASRLCFEILETDPENAGALNLAGVILCQQGSLEEGLVSIARACAVDPDEASYLNNMGTALSSLGRDDDACLTYTRALQLQPFYPSAHNNIGTVLKNLGRLAEAVDHFEKALRQKPDYGEAMSNMGNALVDMGRIDEAEKALENALALMPDYAIAHNNIGTVRQRQGRYGDAEAHLRRAIEIDPLFADPHSNLGEVLKETGRAAEAIPYYRHALDLDADRPGVHSNLVYALNNLDGLDQTVLLNEHKSWGARHASADRAPHDNDPDPDRRIRVGYVSADFRRHACMNFFETLLSGHDRGQVEIYGYANLSVADALTEWLQGEADQWRFVRGHTDDALADLVRADGIDILVDLSGHTMSNRLAVFGRKPAPVQVTWLGYPATTGVEAIDYRITDAWADPPGMTEAYHTEELVRLDHGFLGFRPPPDAPEITPPPSEKNGYVTFGSANNLAKITPAVLDLWADILHRVPNSRLLMKAKAMGDAIVQARYQREFGERGIDAGRLELLGWIGAGSHLSISERIDVALDPFPYNGTTTVCESMWMGVPTVALTGRWHAARVALSLNSRLGHEDLVAKDPSDYLEIAAGLASDGDRLGKLRHSLRDGMVSAGMTDPRRFAGDMERAYRDMWRRWCERQC